MTSDQQAVIVCNINAMFAELGIADRYRLSWNDELQNEAIVVGTITDLDASDELILGVRVCKGGVFFAICAEKAARHYFRREAHVGDYIRVRAYLKPAMFKGEHCYLHVDDEAGILEHIHEG